MDSFEKKCSVERPLDFCRPRYCQYFVSFIKMEGIHFRNNISVFSKYLKKDESDLSHFILMKRMKLKTPLIPNMLTFSGKFCYYRISKNNPI